MCPSELTETLMLRWIAALALCFTAYGCDSGPTSSPYHFDAPVTVFSAEKIYTGDPHNPVVGGVVVGLDGRILATLPLGFADDVTSSNGDVEFVRRPAAFFYPGFVDSHIHLAQIGFRELTLDLTGTPSVQALVERVARELDVLSPGQVLYGRGWIETGWPEERMPQAVDLDVVSPDNPVILERADGHAVVANSKALQIAGIGATTEDPVGGAIERDADGIPTGILIDAATNAVLQLVAAPSMEDLVSAYVIGAQEYVSRGWTAAYNVSVDPAHAPLLKRLALEGRMPLRLFNAFEATGFEIAAERQYETPTITNRAVKLYMDGALGSRGALLLAPYNDRPDMKGVSLMTPDALSQMMQQAAEMDIQLAIHAIGDLANRRVLDAFERGGYGAERRWRIEHTQILHPDDIQRLADLGLIASMQPSHAIGDLKFAPDRLGLQRLRGAYSWQSLVKAGAVLVGGSDAPVEVGSPLIEFYAAVARKDLQGGAGRGWHPEEALTREQALALFTSAAAFASFQEADLGTLEVGKLADITGFDRDLMTVPEAEILSAKAVLTVVNGKVVN